MNIADDVWFEIFLRLSLTAIFRFKCVSKVWFSILSNPNFIKKWYQLNTLSLPWTLVNHAADPQDNNLKRFFAIAYPDSHSQFINHHQNGFSFNFLNQDQNFVNSAAIGLGKLFIIGSSNGLVLITPGNIFRQKSYIVCNPLIEKGVLLPPPPPPPRADDWVVAGFMCECASESSTTSYKVIRIPFFVPGKKFKVEIFSSDLGKWVICNVSCVEDVTWDFGRYDNLVAHNGVLYWFQNGSSRILAVSVGRSNNYIATGGNLECRCIELPGEVTNGAGKNMTQCIGESEGFICYARINVKERTLSVWVLQDDWYSLHKDIAFHDMLAEMESMVSEKAGEVDPIKEIQVLGFNPVDRNVVILGYNKYIWAYNTRTKEYELLCHPPFLGSNLFVPHFSALTCSLKPRPTILPAVSWRNISILDVQE